MRSIHLVAKYSWLSISTPFIQVAEFFRSKGHRVCVHADKGQQLNYSELQGAEYFYSTPILTRSFPILFISSLFRPKPKINGLCICFDTASLIYSSYFLSFERKVYISLELYEVHGRTILGKLLSHLVEFLESVSIRECELIFSQSERRIERLRDKYQLDRQKLRLLPNSNAGSIITGTSDYLRSKFNISINKKIVLFMGSLMVEAGLVDLLKAIPSADEKFVFVFHGWFPDPILKKQFIKFQAQYYDRVFLSCDLLDQKDKYDLIKSADIGCAFFQPIHFNFALGLGSAGKVFDFARCGIPIIANDSEEGHQIVVTNRIGTVTNFSDINIALNEALKIRKEDCNNYFIRNEFSKVFSELYTEITEL
jgi:glycosyltransferase involved in cell wall biosynthesis